MPNLDSKILSYSPQVYRKFNESTVSTAAVNIGSITTDTITINAISQITYAADGPIGATQDSWNFQKVLSTGDSRITHGQANTTAAFNDKDFSVGFWVKWVQYPSNSNVAANSLFSHGTVSATGPGFIVLYGGSSAGVNARKLAIQTSNGTVNTTTYSSILIPNDTNWNYVAVRRSGNLIEVYFNGVFAVSATNGSTTTLTGSPTYGGVSAFPQSAFNLRLSHFYLTPYSTIGATEIQEIWTAGNTPASTRTVKYFNGTSWVDSIGQKVWNGTAWVDWNAKRFDGSAWVNV